MKRFFYIITSLIFLFSFAQAYCEHFSYSKQNKPILILSAMSTESAPLIAQVQSKQEFHYIGIPIVKGTIAGKKVIISYTGIGADNASAISALLIHKYHPRDVILSGCAGSLRNNIHVEDVVVGTKVFSAIFGKLTPQGPMFPGGVINSMRHKDESLVYAANSALLFSARKAAKILREKNHEFNVFFGVIATDQYFPDHPYVTKQMIMQGASAVSMEDTAIAHVAWMFRVPMISIRGISDTFRKNYDRTRVEKAAKSATLVTVEVIKNL